jgi:hypothetical protein
MTTKLEGNLKREVVIGGTAYTVTLSPAGFTLLVKGRRKGLEIAWADLVSGDAALATALNKSLTANLAPPSRGDPRPSPRPRAGEGAARRRMRGEAAATQAKSAKKRR